ncbi:C-X-C chemokine receptor type 2 [Clupea harengus]|uniref:C-X-C chemokine receptor type 2 n=1 Tax=Clupea harengus TaxID=7950 RepID=A0A6P3W7N1_CLUHA|nr:C-X-C chemokine receptor type 2 [Clupea harengus]
MMTDPNTSYLFGDFGDFYDGFNISEELNYTDITENFTVNPLTQSCEPSTFASAVNIATCVFYVLICLLAIPGNLIVGLVIGSKRRVLSASDVYLFHLMMADILLALCLPFYATSVVRGWVFGDVMCKLISILTEVSFYSSILFLVCISVDRYQVIVCAMEVRKGKWRVGSCVICLSVWGLGVMLSLPALYNEAFPVSGLMMCSEHYDTESSDEWRLATRVLRHLLGFLLPLAAMLGCYGVTLARLLRTNGFKRQRAMRVIVAVVAGFLLCWSPYHVALMADTLLRTKALLHNCRTRMAVDVALFATQNLARLHCCVNPVLYAFVGQKFRSNLTELLYRKGVLERASVSRSSRSTSQMSDHPSTVL